LIALATDAAAEAARTARDDPAYIGALKLLSESLLDTCQPGVS
jgi:3-hydroxy-3-methylglutaryl CoA synthase